ncbi:hypothetical protein J1N35_010446, partial [Gossypium stocksii]
MVQLDAEALTRIVREVLEEVFEARIKEMNETLQAGCLNSSKKRDRSLQKHEPCSVKRVKT